MGWKAACIFVSTSRLNDAFSQFPLLDPEKTESIRLGLGLSNYTKETSTTLDVGLYPEDRELVVGGYKNGCVICHRDFPGALFYPDIQRRITGKNRDAEAFSKALIKLYPKGEILCLMLHSVVNLWGYCFYRGGELIRSAAGSADDGLLVDFGEPLPEENIILEKYPIQTVCGEGLGEELVFEISKRIFGKRIDEMEHIDLGLVVYKMIKPSVFNRLLGKS